MTTISRTDDTAALSGTGFDIDVAQWFRNTVFSSFWHAIFAVVLLIINIMVIRIGYNLEPVGLSFNLAPNDQPTAIGNLILTLTSGPLLTSIVLILWIVGVAAVVISAGRHHWPGPTQWLKDSLFTGPFGSLTTLFLSLVIIFAIRGILSWAVFGAEFRTDPESVAVLRTATPGAIWGIIGANDKLFAVGQYPPHLMWRVWLSLGIVLVLAALSVFAWGFGSPLKKMRTALTWSWLASIFVILFLLRGLPETAAGPLESAPTNRWGGFLLTVVISVIGIVASFPIGVLMALGRRSQTRGVPFLWAWGAGLLFISLAFQLNKPP